MRLQFPPHKSLLALHLDLNSMIVAQSIGLSGVLNTLSYMIDEYNFDKILGFLYLGKKKKKKSSRDLACYARMWVG